MARDAVTVTSLTLNSETAAVTGTTIDPANDLSISVGHDTERLLIEVTNTHGSDHDITVVAGANPPAFRAGLGDLTITVPATSGDVFFVLESARFIQSDGTIHIDCETDHAGVAKAYRLPY